MHEDYPITWPGYGPGEEGARYVSKVLNAFARNRGPYFALTHLLDGQAGTHVVLPSFSLPAPGFDASAYDPATRKLLADYEAKYGPRGFSTMTLDQMPLSQTMGDARVIDVRSLVGSTKEADWPKSPSITVDHVKQYESKTRPLAAGDVVLFHSGYSDAHFKPLPAAPEVDRCFAAPLAGKAEGWPAPTPETIAYLAERGVKCVGTDGPTMGGVERDRAAHVAWLAASKNMLLVEYLTNLGALEGQPAYFLFAPIKIQGTRGGYGRAVALPYVD